ncbi:MAG: single-stranded DNA-binding protein [Thomasclavelia sp.]|jgi:single-strand DNA-binding protein|nr:single-stranded DNA-binding protein [Thomasclavelia sp.]
MINEVILVGKILTMPTKILVPNAPYEYKMLLEVEKAFKNVNGEFEYDQISVVLWHGVGEYLLDVAEVGNIISIKGRLTSYTYLNDDGIKVTSNQVVCEKVSFLDRYLR